MLRFGFLSTFPPTRCGIATFTDALASAVEAELGGEARIVRLLDADERGGAADTVDGRVSAHLVAGDGVGPAAAALDDCDVVVVQHEYGIYGGADGDEVLGVLGALHVPAIVVLHTVLRAPTAGQRTVLEQVCALAAAVVVMTGTARRLLEGYAVDPAKVSVIPHGVPARTAVLAEEHETRSRVLTWGLLGPGKGIEWAIRAIAQLADLDPRPTYRVLGQTHPKVLAHQGERYRDGLQALIGRLGVTDRVSIEGRYLSAAELGEAITAADVVVLPYDSRDQVTSGVLVEAIAAGVPVVATGFPHARELLDLGPGIVVAHEDPGAIADAIREILTHGDLAAGMRRAASAATAETGWGDVAQRYARLGSTLRAPVTA